MERKQGKQPEFRLLTSDHCRRRILLTWLGVAAAVVHFADLSCCFQDSFYFCVEGFQTFLAAALRLGHFRSCLVLDCLVLDCL